MRQDKANKAVVKERAEKTIPDLSKQVPLADEVVNILFGG